MSPKKTLVWLAVAGGLFAFIFLFQRHWHKPISTPDKVLPDLKPDAVTSILIRPAGPGQLQIRVDRTNGIWQLSQPLTYAAAAGKVLKLLAFLEQLRPAPYITGSVLRTHRNADEEYGFASPQATLMLQQGNYSPRLRVGALTNPGDQVFVQVEGDLGAYVVDAELLKYLPRSANDWRDTTLLDIGSLAFDHLAVTNNAKGDTERGGLPASSATFVLQRETTNQFWRMAWPLEVRANQSRIEGAVRKLKQLRIRQFVSDDPKTDLDSVGLAPPALELGFANGTNGLGLLQFGRSPTNENKLVYARRAGQTGVFTVDKELLLVWCTFLNDFRDPHLLSLTNEIDSIEITRNHDSSLVQRQSDGSWRLMPGNFPGDSLGVGEFLSGLTNLQIAKFVNDVVNPADLPEYGLAPSLYRLNLRTRCSPSTSDATNTVATQLDFGVGTNAEDKVFAKRSDESSVYAISTNDFSKMPVSSWQLRDRILCHFPATEVSGLTMRQYTNVCQMVRKGPLAWSFAPGSQGIINDAAIEETVRGVVQTAALCWTGRGLPSRAAFGFVEGGYHLTVEFSHGQKFEIEFGGEAPSGNVYAGLMLDGEFWILEFPWIMYRDIDAYLPLKPGR